MAAVKTSKPRPEKSWGLFWTEAFSALSLGWELALPIFGGVLAGYALDKWLQTGHIFTLGLLTAGIFAGFYNIWRFHKRFEEQRKAQESPDDSEREDNEK